MLAASLSLALLLGQLPALTPVRRAPALGVAPAGGVQEAALAASATQALVVWTDGRRRDGFSPEVLLSGPEDLWFSRLSLTQLPPTGVVDQPSRLLCQAGPEERFSGLAVTPVPGGFIAAWRAVHLGGRFRALRAARIDDDGGVSPPCGAEVLVLTDGGSLGPPELATSGNEVLLAWVSNDTPFSVSLSPSTAAAVGTPGPWLPGLNTTVDLDLSLAERPDGGFAMAWVERELDGGVTGARVTLVGSSNGPGPYADARAARLVRAGASLVLVTAEGNTWDLKARSVEPLTSQAFSVGLVSQGQPLAAAVGSTVTVIAAGTWDWTALTLPAPPTLQGLFTPGYTPLDLTSTRAGGLRIAARRERDGALVVLDSPSSGGQPSEEVSLARPAQRLPSLAWAADAGWLVGWREEGGTGPGRLAVLDRAGEWARAPVSFSNALPLLRLASNAAGTRLGYAGLDTPMGVPVSRVDALAPTGLVGPQLLPKLLLGAARLAIGDDQALLWQRTGPSPKLLHGHAGLTLDTELSGSLAARAMGRCAAQAAGALWLPLFDLNGALQLARMADGPVVQPLTFQPVGPTVPVGPGADLTRMRPCAAAQGDLIGITWDEGSTLEFAVFDPATGMPAVRASFSKALLEVFPVVAPLEGGWLIATESNVGPLPSIVGRLVSPGLELVETLSLSEEATPLEARGPELAAGAPGSVGIAWSVFDLQVGAVEVRARTLRAPAGGIDWSLDGGGRDAGVDAGAVDAGAVDAGGGGDAGDRDGGADGGAPGDGGEAEPVVVFSSCGCRAVDAALVFPVALLWVLALRRHRSPARR
jgi:hypothetical protein